MKPGDNLFSIWGGLRRMAKDLHRAPSTVHGWKKEGRIPANEQPHVLQVARDLRLPITAEHIVFPLGRPVEIDPGQSTFQFLAAAGATVACDQTPKTQQEDIV